jgi:hypothetical protein
MESLSGAEKEVPVIKWTEYIEAMERIDVLVDPYRGGNYSTINQEFYGVIDGWEGQSHKFVHDLVTARIGLKLYTRASLLDLSGRPAEKYMNAPDAVEEYTMQILAVKSMVTVHINTADPDLIRELHGSFFEVLLGSQNLEQALEWLTKESKYAKMKSTIDPKFPLLDFVSRAEF